jgi:hypothetical protein
MHNMVQQVRRAAKRPPYRLAQPAYRRVGGCHQAMVWTFAEAGYGRCRLRVQVADRHGHASFELVRFLHNRSRVNTSATPERRSSNDTTIVGQPASTLRGGKKRCSPTEDRDLLARDPNKIYQCTRKCGKRYGRKCDWKRNEEEGYPCKSWVCSLCISEGVENVRPCFRKYHFVQVSDD